MTATRPQQFTVEPPQARDMIVNLIKYRRKFALELSDDRRVKDVVCIAIGGALVRRDDSHLYAQSITYRTRDDATGFALQCLAQGICFDMTAADYPDGRAEWSFTAEKEKRRGLDGK